MKNMTIGKKIALGFAALILICAALGGVAVYNMAAVQTQARTLAEGYVPETVIASDLQDAIANAQLGIRSYGFTADAAYLDAARKALTAAHTQQQAAQKLSDAHPELVKLRAALKDLEPLLQAYEGLIAQTEAKNKDILDSRDKLNQAAADFIVNIDKLIAGQKVKQANEIKAFAEASRLQQRADKLALANAIRGEGNAARIAVFKSLAVRDPRLIEEGLKGFGDMDQKFDELLALLVVPEDIAELKKVEEDAHAYRDAMKQTMDDNAALVEIGKQRLATATQLDTLATDIEATGMQRTVEAANTSKEKLAASSWTMIVGLIGALLVGITVAYLIIRNSNRVLTTVANALNEGAEQVASASGQVSSASQTLAEGASQQASSLEETSSSLEEMSSMTKRNSENALKANELAKEARAAADKGAGDMQTMAAAMEAIKVSSDDIGKIIKTIDEIAFQTNILALNAAVEAARAGEAGMGFAVVADEVRNLAQRCAQAAKETSGKIEGAIAKSGQGVEITSKVAAALNEIVSKVRQVDELVTEVAGASREQTEGIAQINQATGAMDKLTQSNAATAEESAAAAEELSSQAQVMKQSVADLLQLVGGKCDATTHLAEVHVRHAHLPKPPAKHVAPVKSRNGHGNGNGHPAKATVAADKRRSEIPMDGDFKDF
ncbi:MAG TPA: methyl-accepting chemotaxis protein [Candidatus Acidoferrales bacterium]|jgi:methyl-accepting chemotaxis protein|nr:methyl-accepting chemotaxis protein [Candidatus Acidoferrales bacterium]